MSLEAWGNCNPADELPYICTECGGEIEDDNITFGVVEDEVFCPICIEDEEIDPSRIEKET